VRPINRRAFALLAAILMVTTGTEAASLLDPAFHFKTLTTEHFVIYFHQGEDHLAGRLAVIAEEEWPRVGQALGITAPRHTHVILADQSELANGWATPLPYNLIFVTAAAPPGSDFIGRTDDWLRLVFTHEFTHIVHLDRSEGWARIFRGIFGRTSLSLPNTWLPVWQIEGLAAWEESAITGEGRLHAGDFRAIEREAARSGRVVPIDRINGGLTDWPTGLAPYAFGLGFHDYLSQRFGDEQFGALAARTSRSLPFLGSRAFKKVYGESLGDLWKDYQRSESAEGPSNALNGASPRNVSVSPPFRVTHEGFTILGPRFAPSACGNCAPEIVYTARNPDGFPSLNAVGVGGGDSRRLAWRYLGSTMGIWGPTIVFDQQQVHRNVGLYSDLFTIDRQTGAVRTLTSGERLQDPDLSADGMRVVAVRQVAGRGEIVSADMTSGISRIRNETVLVSETDTQFSTPKWSPDGRQVAVERHRLGALSEIIVLDISTRAVRVVASDPMARIVTPAWRRDGRAIVAAADFNGDTFNLYEFDVDTAAAPRQLTHTSGGALWPDVSPGGDLIAFAGYTVDGFDVFTIPYAPAEAGEQAPADARHDAPKQDSRDRLPQASGGPEIGRYMAQKYSPWPTLPPTSWFPLVETADNVRAGFAVNGVDVLGRHAYSASATWLVAAPVDVIKPAQGVPDWDLGYAYDRWQPTFFASASSHTFFDAGPADENGKPTPATERTREVEGGVLLPIRRVQSLQRAFFSVVRTDDRYTLPTETVTFSRMASRVGLASSTARLYGYSISPEDGYSVGGTAEVARRGFGSSIDETTFTMDGRAYLPGLRAHHIVAVRGAAGTSSGTPGGRRNFLLGGALSAGDVLDFGRDAMSLLRGFPSQSFAGTHVALLNADYRFPIARPQRGKGTWPLFLHTIHAAVFADAGEAWTEQFRAHNAKTSAGGELSLNLIAGYSFPVTATIGAALGHDGTDRSNRATMYVRIGRAF
jgi:Tol biopolymer transport system component